MTKLIFESEKDIKQLLNVMKTHPVRPRTEWAKSLGWLNKKEQPDQPKINNLLKQLEIEGRVIQIGHRYVVV